MGAEERRLSDRILSALELAIDQEDLGVAEHLAKALEEALTRFGGPGVPDRRELPDDMLVVLDRLDHLRRRTLAG